MQKKRADGRMHYGARSAYGTDCMESKPQETGTLHRYETCSLLVSCMANSFRTMFMLQSKTGMPPTPPTPPTPPDTPLDECFFPMPSPELSTCLLQGCGKMVKRMWNHLDYHKKRGDILPQQLYHTKRSRWSSAFAATRYFSYGHIGCSPLINAQDCMLGHLQHK